MTNMARALGSQANGETIGGSKSYDTRRAADPAQRSFDHPSLGQARKAFDLHVGALDDNDGYAAGLLGGLLSSSPW